MDRTTTTPRPDPRRGLRSKPQPGRPGGAKLPHPLFELRLFGLRSARLDMVATVVLIAVVVASRIAAVPASIWDQDEAYFATAVASFDPTANHPHPPWFPAFVGLGTLVHSLGPDPARSLQLVSAVLGCWMFFPLAALWSAVIGRRLGIVAATLFMFLPGPWLLAGRAYSGTAATALMTAGLALMSARPDHRWSWPVGAGFMGLAVLTRPHLLPTAVVALVVVERWRSDRRRVLWAVFAAVGISGTSALVVASSGLEPLLGAVAQHARYHFDSLAGATGGLGDSGLARCLAGPTAAWIWTMLAAIGMWSTLRDRTSRPRASMIVGALVPVVVVVVGVSDPGHARYFVPVLAWSSGFVVAALGTAGRGLAVAAAGTAVVLSAVTVGPQLGSYRSASSPVIEALQAAVAPPDVVPPVLVADHSLISFVGWVRSGRRDFPAVIYDNQIESHLIPPPPPSYSVAVFAAGHGGLIQSDSGRRSYSCSIPILRVLERDRFLDIRVSTRPVLRGWVDDGRPYVIIDGG